MIEQITLNSETYDGISAAVNAGNKVVIDCSNIIKSAQSFTIEITFSCAIALIRNHDYTWHDAEQSKVIVEFSPKIIKLSSGFLVQANITMGIWEFDAKKPTKLFWKFNTEYSKPITVYSGVTNTKTYIQANSYLHFPVQPALLFTDRGAIEISKSKIPFSAITCFTDHCDFDTEENLIAQREFFKKKNIKVTKGFFLNHFSKRGNNASVERNFREIELWQNDGHELCYHSLSQSIKSDEESFHDFKNFTPPFLNCTTWIDHGYQPYNFSLFQKNKINKYEYEILLKEKRIEILWNYIDTGTATNGVINQLNSNHFTLSSFLKGNRDVGVIKLVQMMIKNIVFHYHNDEKTISNYKLTALHFKKIMYQKQYISIFKFVKNFAVLSKKILSLLLLWNSIKNRPFKFAKYTPLFFKHIIGNQEFVVFQTLELIDFKKSLTKNNVDLLIKEGGVFIAHTYFSDSISYHRGTLLDASNQIDITVAKNFNYLSEKVKDGSIWNPTLKEFYNYIKQFDEVEVDFDDYNNLFVKNPGTLEFRTIT